ncbi:SDR family NAD(P)-dependent oxidoreductase [Roseofilum reptotaenium CS-1145]|uniref:Carrier domain-containing protein n=1 Tax=Roseofilum reptotaenium AO1-A TaxID=1925591 RepID=A0A1L9QP86_9CYAN|nr:SDR family NAD(P)-dependent oxidoreductase [Roseofilum reptotaenium]MDB9520155.1 SDR family NAD(P)-dependent oxidoreductase [Roseofilum reptotaenium CS-1145]OJJ24490.1 hypothetical protein BI308_16400 [Roseofilum reptotaenium AO1-A]
MNQFEDLAQIFQRLSRLSPEQLRALEILLLNNGQNVPNESKTLLGDYYDELSAIEDEDAIINYPAIPQIINDFSWVFIGEKSTKSYEIARAARQEMRRMSWRVIDFSACKNALDVGCGHGTDVVELTRKYPHLSVTGYTLSSKQVEIGSGKIEKFKLQDRAQILRRDSSKDDFPGSYDLVYGFEVICHIPDKKGLFDNIDRHLNENGHLVFADFFSNASFSIDYEAHSSYLITKAEWIELLSNHHLQVVSYVDISHEVGNGLYDPNVQENIDYICQLKNLNENAKTGIESYMNLYKLLRKGLLSYVLVTAQKRENLSVQELYDLNQKQLEVSLTYPEVSLQQLFYGIEWQLREKNSKVSTGQNPGHWLILADGNGFGKRLKGLLEKQGQQCTLVYPKGQTQHKEPEDWEVNPLNPQEFTDLCQKLGATHPEDWRGMIHLWSLESPTPENLSEEQLRNAQNLGCGSALHLLQGLLKSGLKRNWPKLWLVTQGSQPVGENPKNLAVAQSSLWGFGQVVSLEHPHLWGALVDLDPETDRMELLLAELLNPTAEDRIAFRSGQAYVARLAKTLVAESEAVSFTEEGTYLITGGLGALGLRTAEWMIEKGAKSLILISRSQPSPEKQNQIARLQEQGAKVRAVQVDVCDRQALESVIEKIPDSMPPLKGVIHLAGVSGGIEPVENITHADLESVLAAKVMGGWNLHQLTQTLDLECFVCFSSIAAVWGSFGQSHYGGANAFLDSLVHYRRSLGLPGVSINWGAWSGGGMANAEDLEELSKRGVYSISPAQGMGALEQLWNSTQVQTTVAEVDWSRFKEIYTVGKDRLFLEHMGLRSPEEDETPSTAPQSEILTQLQRASLPERKKRLTQYIQQEIGKLLKYPANQLPDLQLGFFEMGIDSLTAVELRNELSSGLSCALSAATLFDCSNIRDLAEFILTEFFTEPASGEQNPTPSTPWSAELGDLSDEQLEDEISQELEGIETLLAEGE